MSTTETTVRWQPGTLVQWERDGERVRGVIADEGQVADWAYYVVEIEGVEEVTNVRTDQVAPAFERKLEAIPLADGTLVRVGDRICRTSRERMREGTVYELEPRELSQTDWAKRNERTGLLDLEHSGFRIRMESDTDYVEQFVARANFRGDNVQTGMSIPETIKVEETREQKLRRELRILDTEISALTRVVNGLLARKDERLRSRQDVVADLRALGQWQVADTT